MIQQRRPSLQPSASPTDNHLPLPLTPPTAVSRLPLSPYRPHCPALSIGFGLLVAGGVYFNDNMQRIGDKALDITLSVSNLVSNIGLLVKDVAGIPVVSQSLPGTESNAFKASNAVEG